MSREDILREARRIPASDLTLPLIAKRLGVKTASLYYHFASRDVLLTALSAQLVGELPIHAADPAHWRNWLGTAAREIYRFVLANPIMFEVASWPLTAGAGTTLVEAALETLEGAGFAPEDALLVWSAVANFAFGQARFVHDMRGKPLARRAADEALTKAGQDLPHLRAAAAAFSGRDPVTLIDELFDRLVALLSDPASSRASSRRKNQSRGPST